VSISALCVIRYLFPSVFFSDLVNSQRTAHGIGETTERQPWFHALRPWTERHHDGPPARRILVDPAQDGHEVEESTELEQQIELRTDDIDARARAEVVWKDHSERANTQIMSPRVANSYLPLMVRSAQQHQMFDYSRPSTIIRQEESGIIKVSFDSE
jgi:hypothetical protein